MKTTVRTPSLLVVILGASPSGSQYTCAKALTGEIGAGVYRSES